MGKKNDYAGTLWEEWRPIPGYEGLYQVSNEGKVRSLNYNHTGKTKVIKPFINHGYLRVQLYKDGEKKKHRVHRLVWEAFRGKIPEGLQVNHLDEVKTNNCLDNLEICTPRENTNYGTRNERAGKANKKALIGNTNGKANINNPSTSKAVNQIDIVTGKILNTYQSTREAERQTGIYHSTIAKCCLNRPNFNSAGGFIWQYDE